MRILSAALVLNKGIDDWCGLFLSKLHCFPNIAILTLHFELEKVCLNQNGMKKKQRSWKKWTSHLSRRSGRIVFTARVTTLHSCCDFALVLLEKFSPSGQSEVRNILMYQLRNRTSWPDVEFMPYILQRNSTQIFHAKYFVANYWQEQNGSCRDSTNHESGLGYRSM